MTCLWERAAVAGATEACERSAYRRKDEVADDFQCLARQAIDELRAVLTEVPLEASERLIAEVTGARRIVCAAAGREGLMLRAFCMRLMHLGFDVHMEGDVTAPPIGPGDLFLAVVGPGKLATLEALLRLAREAGARTLVVTAQPGGPVPRMADVVVHLPAQTMADDQGTGGSVLPMGTLFEIAELVFFDLVCVVLRERTGQTTAQVRARHFNLE